MLNYEVKQVVCDYGIFENGELKFILNKNNNAKNIVQILKEDARCDGRLKTYDEWKENWCKEHNIKIIDDDGGRQLDMEGNTYTLMTKEEANKYLIINTIIRVNANK